MAIISADIISSAFKGVFDELVNYLLFKCRIIFFISILDPLQFMFRTYNYRISYS